MVVFEGGNAEKFPQFILAFAFPFRLLGISLLRGSLHSRLFSALRHIPMHREAAVVSAALNQCRQLFFFSKVHLNTYHNFISSHLHTFQQARGNHFSTGGGRVKVKNQVLSCNMIRWLTHPSKSYWLLMHCKRKGTYVQIINSLVATQHKSAICDFLTSAPNFRKVSWPPWPDHPEPCIRVVCRLFRNFDARIVIWGISCTQFVFLSSYILRICVRRCLQDFSSDDCLLSGRTAQ